MAVTITRNIAVQKNKKTNSENHLTKEQIVSTTVMLVITVTNNFLI